MEKDTVYRVYVSEKVPEYLYVHDNSRVENHSASISARQQ